MFEKEISSNPYAQKIAKDIIIDFSKMRGLEQLIWEVLAIDDLQSILLRTGQNESANMAQLQSVKDFLKH